MWFKRDKTEYIKVPRVWAEELATLCAEASFGFRTEEKDVNAHVVVGYASNIKNYLGW